MCSLYFSGTIQLLRQKTLSKLTTHVCVSCNKPPHSSGWQGNILPTGYRRGYAVALLIGLSETGAAVWKIFSHVAKPERTIPLTSRKDARAVYNFHEALVNALRPTLNEGTKSIIIAAPPRTSYGEDLLAHIRGHHVWLIQGTTKATFSTITGQAFSVHDVTVLTRTAEFKKLVGETTTTETENLLELFEKRLNADQPLVLYSLQESEDAIYGGWLPGKPKPELLIMTDSYLSSSRQKGRVQRLLQVATNRGVKTRVVVGDSVAGKRLLQFGGLVCILKPD
jgi:stalled ribosome rescue protein Dom34